MSNNKNANQGSGQNQAPKGGNSSKQFEKNPGLPPTAKLTYMAAMAAVSIFLVLTIRIKFFPAAPFLEYSPGDVPMILASFLFGPISGFILTVVACVIQGITVSADGGPIGIFMHVAVLTAYVIPAGIIIRKKHSTPWLIFGAVVGIISAVVIALILNYFVTPIYMKVPTEAVVGLILPALLPFNLLQYSLNSFLALALYPLVRMAVLKYKRK